MQEDRRVAGKEGHAQPWFAATHWSVVLAAAQADPQRRAAALEVLCRTYWEPLYAYVRRLGYRPHDAQDLVQGFLARLFTGQRLAGVAPTKGKFRSFLLAALNHFLADERDRAGAAKRGGAWVIAAPDVEAAERHCVQETTQAQTPGAAFDRRWALTLLDRALSRLRQEYQASGKSAAFAELSTFLAAEGTADDYAAVGRALHMAPGSVAVAVHRLRQQYRQRIRAEVAHTVPCADAVDEEMHYLLELLCADG